MLDLLVPMEEPTVDGALFDQLFEAPSPELNTELNTEQFPLQPPLKDGLLEAVEPLAEQENETIQEEMEIEENNIELPTLQEQIAPLVQQPEPQTTEPLDVPKSNAELMVALFQEVKQQQPMQEVEKSTTTKVTQEVITLSKGLEKVQMKEVQELQQMKQWLQEKNLLPTTEAAVVITPKEEKIVPTNMYITPIKHDEAEGIENPIAEGTIDTQMVTKTTEKITDVRQVKTHELPSYLTKEFNTTIETYQVSPRKMVIELNPGHLGKVEVILEKNEDGVLIAQFRLEKEASKELVEKALEETVTAFEEKGTVLKVDVKTETSPSNAEEESLKEENKKEKRKGEEDTLPKDTKEFEKELFDK